ncbi:phage tail tape measure protein [Lacticaseibacillus saniviri]|uniref:phage tail tape measure protein n=1 Tax=Lacticaseibacillus saniviri TaxID=931533 RepID=UPI0006D28C74|nr:phage tail tape measure protein [Lacticaseibacillus saniviri]
MAEDVLGRMVIELGLDHSDFGRGLQGAQREAKYAMAEMKSSLSVVAASGREVDTLRVKQAGLTKAIEAQARVVAEQKRQYEGSRTATGAATGATAKYATQLQNANAKLNSLQNQLQATARAYAEIQTRTEGFTGGLNRIGTAATSAGAKMSSVGKTMTMGVTVPLAAGFVAATNKAMEFDNKMLETKNLIQTGGESAQEAISGVSTMSKDAITLSNHYGVSVNKIADGYQDLVKRGYTSSQAIGAMKTELQGALASGDDFSDVVTVASQTLEAFDMRAKQHRA